MTVTVLSRFVLSSVMTLVFLFGLLACNHPREARRAPARPAAVSRHFIVLVTENDPKSGEPRDSLVLGEPLDQVMDARTAFAFTNGAYRIGVAWDVAPAGSRCLGVTVARAGDPVLPDFQASGCVPTNESTRTVAKVDRAGGGSIEVVVWFFDDASAPRLPSASPDAVPAPAPGPLPSFVTHT